MPFEDGDAALSSAVLHDAAMGLGELAMAPTVERAVDAFRDFLGMEVAFIGHLTPESEVFRTVRGDSHSFGFSEGTCLRRDMTYCQRVLDGRLPQVITDVRAEPRAAALPITGVADIGAFVSLPLRFSDGLLFGMLCAACHDPKLDLGYRDHQFLNVFARLIADILEREKLQQLAQDAETQDAAMHVLLAALDSRDSYTSSHSRTVVTHAVAVAEALGLSVDEVKDVRRVAVLHDVGKLAIPDAILHKPGPLSAEEWEVMKTHSIAGEELLRRVPSLQALGAAIRAEHEHWDGSGYPDGLQGEQIPLASRITLVCDAFHAMTSDRPYRSALSETAAADEIEAHSGTQFCPAAAAAFLSLVRPNPSPSPGQPSSPNGPGPSFQVRAPESAFYRGLCRCESCGSHSMADIGCRIAGQCPVCDSYNLVEV